MKTIEENKNEVIGRLASVVCVESDGGERGGRERGRERERESERICLLTIIVFDHHQARGHLTVDILLTVTLI